MRLSELNIYPIKSLKGLSRESAAVEERGLARDRRLMLVDSSNQFLTQRSFPRMSLIDVEISNGGLTASIDGTSVSIPDAIEGESARVQIWSSKVKAETYGPEINKWFSDVLGTECKLVRMPEETKRKVNYWYAVHKNKDTVSFADGYPFLLIGQASLDDLNSRLESPVPMNRFRPNFVVSGSEPFEEDSWKKIRIGETVFHLVKPCGRCVITTIDQATAEKGKEPLKTLAAYRTRRGKVLFGQNLIAENAGNTIRIGDKVEILERK